jgi:hypothetical protein
LGLGGLGHKGLRRSHHCQGEKCREFHRLSKLFRCLL